MVKRLLRLVPMIVLALGLNACGGGGDGPPLGYTTQILSDSAYDGDIGQTSASSYAVVQGMSPSVQSVFAGIDPATGIEYRSFLNFPLSGPGGVPSNAIIDSAYLHIVVSSLQPSGASLPLLLDLVSFQPPALIGSDFDRNALPALASVTVAPPLSTADVGTDVVVDVTALMVQAQRQGLPDFQLRLLEDLGANVSALAEINDTTGANRTTYAPLLVVNYH